MSLTQPSSLDRDMNQTRQVSRFRRIGSITIFAVYFLILVGGIVRASGAGMGCPDWPTCFGQWIPPTEESQLPANYQEIYADVGYKDTRFNPVKTWTEYINRLVGSTIGLLITTTLLLSVPLFRRDPGVFYRCLAVFFLVGFQAWLGSVVVKSNLHDLMITAHMLLAFAIVALLISAISRSQKDDLTRLDSSGLSPLFGKVLLVAMGLTVVQVVMGTLVRDAIDIIAHNHNFEQRELWRQEFPVIFYIHRSFSAIVLFTNLWLVWQIIRRAPAAKTMRNTGLALIGIIGCSILTGVTMDRLGFPAAAQPLHLLFASLIFGGQFFLYICLRFSTKRPSEAQHDIATPA